MIVELRAVPGCPNVDATRDVLRRCLAEAGLQVAVIERVGDYPSPSVLIGGRDVTGADPNGPAACVLRPPTADQIHAALSAPGTGSSDDVGSVGVDRTARGADSAASECCPPGDAVRTDRPRRAAALPPEVRAVHRQLLRHFAATGVAPTPAELAQVAADAAVDPQAALRRLAEDDLLAVDGAGRMVAAYPFSPTSTDHTVEVDGVRMYAMCAIDALGIPAMLDCDATITSTDAQSGQPITVRVTGGAVVFDPPGTVVVYASAGRGGRSVDSCCSTINFFAGPVSARAWIAAHPHLTSDVLDQDRAVALGRGIFGPLLRP